MTIPKKKGESLESLESANASTDADTKKTAEISEI